MTNNEIYTIDKTYEGIYKEKGSRFLAYAMPLDNKDKVKDIIKAYKKEHNKAKHVCFAYRLGTNGEDYRASDNGEPSGTAGRPILRQLEAKKLTNTLVVVVRYFGGTLLGTGGLINAYRSATEDALSTIERLPLNR